MFKLLNVSLESCRKGLEGSVVVRTVGGKGTMKQYKLAVHHFQLQEGGEEGETRIGQGIGNCIHNLHNTTSFSPHSVLRKNMQGNFLLIDTAKSY